MLRIVSDKVVNTEFRFTNFPDIRLKLFEVKCRHPVDLNFQYNNNYTIYNKTFVTVND